MVTFIDMSVLMANIVFFALLAWLVTRLIIFVPRFMLSLMKKVKNKSPIYREKDVFDTDLDKGTLEKSEFGLKSLINFWK